MARNKFDIDETLERDAEFKLAHLARLAKYLRPYKFLMLRTVLIVLIPAALFLLVPYFTKIVLDYSIPNKDVKQLLLISALALGIFLLNIPFFRMKITAMSKIGQGIIRDLRLDLFRHLQKLPNNYYDGRPHGKILVRVVNYINSISELLSNGLVNMIGDLFNIAVIIVIMLLLNVRLTLFSLAGLPVLIFVINIIRIKIRKTWRKYNSKTANMNAYIHESIAGVRITRSFAREARSKGIFNTVISEVRDNWLKAVRYMHLLWPAVDGISTLTKAGMYIGGVIWLSGGIPGNGVSLGDLIAMIGYSSRFWGPINNLANYYNSIVVNMTYLERIFEAIDEPVIISDLPGAAELPPVEGNVVFEDVAFGYEKDTPILNGVSFTVKAGDKIALVGPTGAGKTTVVNLLSRFYDLDSGRILIDGRDIRSVTLKSLRSQMSVMLQDTFIFSGTVMENIRYGRLDATDDEVMEAAKAVRAHDFISWMEKGYETEVRERGGGLSSGQRQLISFARALLADPRILILDEATSSIDVQTEKALQEGLDRLLAGRTSFIIAHRLSTIKNADTIMYVDGRGIMESGRHDELIEKQGRYSELYNAQYEFLKGKEVRTYAGKT